MSIPGPQVSYVDLLNHEITEEQENSDGGNYFPLRPSAAGYCSRRLAYALHQYYGLAPREVEIKKPDTVRLLDLGWYIENHLIKFFRKCKNKWFDVRYNQAMVTLWRLKAKDLPEISHLIEGSLDSCLISDKWKCVIDYKSKKDKFHRAYKTDWDYTNANLGKLCTKISDTGYYVEDLPSFLKKLNDPFFANNFYQLNVYACSQFAKDRGIDHASIMQYNKNDSRVREIRFKPSPKVFNETKKKFQHVLDTVVSKHPEAVEKDFILGSMSCAFCPFTKNCWGDVDSLKEWFKTFPDKEWPDRVAKLKNSKALEVLFTKLEQCDEVLQDRNAAHDGIVKILEPQKVKKVEIPNGNVYEMKLLKSPRPHFKLRRSKK